MTTKNQNLSKLFTSDTFADIVRNKLIKTVEDYKKSHPHKEIYMMTWGDTTHPIPAKVIEAMEDHHRLLIDLIYFQGYTQKEAAEATDTPLGTIKSRIRAAIKVLRKRLDDLDFT